MPTSTEDKTLSYHEIKRIVSTVKGLPGMKFHLEPSWNEDVYSIVVAWPVDDVFGAGKIPIYTARAFSGTGHTGET